MATWVTHLMVADEVIKKIPSLCKHEFFVGKYEDDGFGWNYPEGESEYSEKVAEKLRNRL